MQKKKREKVYKLLLEKYSSGRQIAALKVVHLFEENYGTLAETKLHRHNFYELVVVMKGSGIHEINGQDYKFRPGQIFLIRPVECHRYLYPEQLTLLTFMFDRKVLRQFRAQLENIPGFNDLFPEAAEHKHHELIVGTATMSELDILLDSIAMAGLSDLPGVELLQTVNFINVLVLILQNMHDNIAEERINSDIGAAVSYIMRNFQNCITLDELARMTNMSQSSFCRKFKKDFKVSPIEWLLRLRIHKAMNFLSRSDMTIAEVAEAVGFTDPLYFSRQFRKFTGFSPTSYRKRDSGVLHVIYKNESFLENNNLEF